MLGSYLIAENEMKTMHHLELQKKFDVKRLFIKELGDLGQRADFNELCDLEEFT